MLSVVYSATSLILMFVGIRWGAVGIATAQVSTAVLLMPWLLYYSLAGSPVSVGAFWRSASRPLVASLTMAAALLLLQNFTHLESALLSLTAACGTAIAVYFLTLNFLPGGRDQLQSLLSELVAALRKRSSVGGAGQ